MIKDNNIAFYNCANCYSNKPYIYDLKRNILKQNYKNFKCTLFTNTCFVYQQIKLKTEEIPMFPIKQNKQKAIHFIMRHLLQHFFYDFQQFSVVSRRAIKIAAEKNVTNCRDFFLLLFRVFHFFCGKYIRILKCQQVTIRLNFFCFTKKFASFLLIWFKSNVKLKELHFSDIEILV